MNHITLLSDRLCALLGLLPLALACGAAPDTVIALTPEAPGAAAQDAPTAGPADLQAALQRARQEWAEAGVERALEAPVPFVEYLPIDALTEACHYPATETGLMGCWRHELGHGLYFVEGLLERRLGAQVVRHELGHRLREQGGHLCKGKGAWLMCQSGNDEGEITERDVAFVLHEDAP